MAEEDDIVDPRVAVSRGFTLIELLVVGAHDPKNKWRRTGQKSPDTIPVLMDCGFILTRQSVQGRPLAVALEVLEVVSVR